LALNAVSKSAELRTASMFFSMAPIKTRRVRDLLSPPRSSPRGPRKPGTRAAPPGSAPGLSFHAQRRKLTRNAASLRVWQAAHAQHRTLGSAVATRQRDLGVGAVLQPEVRFDAGRALSTRQTTAPLPSSRRSGTSAGSSLLPGEGERLDAGQPRSAPRLQGGRRDGDRLLSRDAACAIGVDGAEPVLTHELLHAGPGILCTSASKSVQPGRRCVRSPPPRSTA
jgi:hypothetical protein